MTPMFLLMAQLAMIQPADMAARVQAIPCGGIGLMHELVRALKLAESIDEHVHVFKKHFPYHESDHVLNLAYNVLAGGTRLEDIERRRTNEGYLDTLGCRRIPDPTNWRTIRSRIGRPATAIIGLGRSWVSGSRRVPFPPAMITAAFGFTWAPNRS